LLVISFGGKETRLLGKIMGLTGRNLVITFVSDFETKVMTLGNW
jgi:hypothetical protein